MDTAQRLLDSYRDWEDRDLSSEELLIDMLATLRHFADQCGEDFGKCDQIAHDHYLDEISRSGVTP